MMRAMWTSLVIFVAILVTWALLPFPSSDLVYMALLLVWGLVSFGLVIVATGRMDAQELAQVMTETSINYWHRGWIYPDPLWVEEESK